MSLENKTEKELIEIARKNSYLSEVIGEFYRRHNKAIQGFLYYKFKTGEETEDLSQETFFKVFRNFDKYENLRSATFKTWIYQIAKNTALDLFRRNQTKSKLLERGREKYLEESRSTILNPEEQAILNEEKEIIKKEVNSLPNKLKEIFMLKDNGISYLDISQILGIQSGTVKSRVFRSRKILKKRLMENYDILSYDF